MESIRARGFVHEWSAQEVGHLLRISSRTAQARVHESADLASVMPATLACVSAGFIEAWQAVKMLAFLRDAGADDDTIRDIDAYLAGRLATTDPSRLLWLVRYALGRIRPDLLPERAKKARETSSPAPPARHIYELMIDSIPSGLFTQGDPGTNSYWLQ